MPDLVLVPVPVTGSGGPLVPDLAPVPVPVTDPGGLLAPDMLLDPFPFSDPGWPLVPDMVHDPVSVTGFRSIGNHFFRGGSVMDLPSVLRYWSSLLQFRSNLEVATVSGIARLLMSLSPGNVGTPTRCS